jgi:hypothetical protein
MEPNASNTRKAKVLFDGEWIDIEPLAIKEGMRFRMFEEDGSPVNNIDPDLIFMATSDAYVDENGIIGIKMSFTFYEEEEENEDN